MERIISGATEDFLKAKKGRRCRCGEHINEGDLCVLVFVRDAEGPTGIDTQIVCSWSCVADLREVLEEISREESAD